MGLFDTLLGGLIGAGGQAANSFMSAQYQQALQQQQMKWQSAENQRDRLWQQQNWLKQFMAENEEWQRRFDAQNQYNDPSALMGRLQRAGINPAAAMGQLSGAGGLAAAGGSSQPNMPVAMPSHSVTPLGLHNPFQGIDVRQIMSGISDLMNATTNRQRLGLDTEYQNATLVSIVKKLNADAEQSESAKNYNDVMSFLNSYRLEDKVDAQITKTWNEAFEAATRGDYNKASQILQYSLADLTDNKSRALQKVLPQYQLILDKQVKVYDSQAELNRAGAQQARAAAKREEATYLTMDALRAGQVRGQDLANSIAEARDVIAHLDADTAEKVQPQKIEALLSAYEREGWITAEQKEKAALAAKENKWYEVTKVLDSAESATRSVKNIAETFESGTRSVKNIVSSASITHFLLGQ